MLIHTLAAAAATAAPQNKFGIAEVLFPDGKPAWIPLTTFGILLFMSVGSFFILFTKWSEQSKLMKQYGSLAGFCAWTSASNWSTVIRAAPNCASLQSQCR